MARKILLADDSVTAQNMGRKILADAGYEVIAVNNGSAALKKIIEIKPDVVVLDIYMPGYSGLEVCQRLKESPETARIPVLLTVGKLEPFRPEEAQRVRAEAFIVKPFEASELLSALSKLEDKVVPRPEPSRPGRFARTIAAMDDSGRGEREDAPSADNGWKNRIGFPHEKSEAERRAEEAEQQEQQKFVEESSRYNRRKSDQKETAKVEAGEQKSAGREAKTVDVSALSSAGVSSALPKDVSQEEVSALAAAATQMQAVASAMEQNRALESSPVAPSASEPSPEAASRPVDDKPGDKETKSPSQAESEAQDAPVTMAAAAGSSDAAGGSRWTAVAVALEKDEAAVSLHEEMQKAFAKDSSAAPAQAAAAAAESVSSASEFSVLARSAAPAGGETDSQSDSQSAAMATSEDAAPAGGVEPVVAASPSESVPADAEPMRPFSKFAGEVSSDQIESPSVQIERFGTQDESGPAPMVETANAVEKAELSADTSTSEQSTASTSERSEAQPETEAVRNTAEAWANWSQSHVPQREPESAAATEQRESVPSEPAEMNAAAVAAGAEQLLQAGANGQTEGNPHDVASIVDSVLAGLRSKLMEEISRKMSEKK